eukprot:TRINITY_DN6965_c0_g2_i1.p1 TRINITY_DN6965_c0_g2~~TRINITY_DN6965_c0_g2_i1.p1  ORF type:complete len:814 (+),score=212.29 TRINITY_DN6965_c0_g2_i1:71-2443(+)
MSESGPIFDAAAPPAAPEGAEAEEEAEEEEEEAAASQPGGDRAAAEGSGTAEAASPPAAPAADHSAPRAPTGADEQPPPDSESGVAVRVVLSMAAGRWWHVVCSCPEGTPLGGAEGAAALAALLPAGGRCGPAPVAWRRAWQWDSAASSYRAAAGRAAAELSGALLWLQRAAEEDSAAPASTLPPALPPRLPVRVATRMGNGRGVLRNVQALVPSYWLLEPGNELLGPSRLGGLALRQWPADSPWQWRAFPHWWHAGKGAFVLEELRDLAALGARPQFYLLGIWEPDTDSPRARGLRLEDLPPAEEGDPPPQEQQQEDWPQRFEAFYSMRCPDKVGRAAEILRRHPGGEEALWRSLLEKHGVTDATWRLAASPARLPKGSAVQPRLECDDSTQQLRVWCERRAPELVPRLPALLEAHAGNARLLLRKLQKRHGRPWAAGALRALPRQGVAKRGRPPAQAPAPADAPADGAAHPAEAPAAPPPPAPAPAAHRHWRAPGADPRVLEAAARCAERVREVHRRSRSADGKPLPRVSPSRASARSASPLQPAARRSPSPQRAQPPGYAPRSGEPAARPPAQRAFARRQVAPARTPRPEQDAPPPPPPAPAPAARSRSPDRGPLRSMAAFEHELSARGAERIAALERLEIARRAEEKAAALWARRERDEAARDRADLAQLRRVEELREQQARIRLAWEDSRKVLTMRRSRSTSPPRSVRPALQGSDGLGPLQPPRTSPPQPYAQQHAPSPQRPEDDGRPDPALHTAKYYPLDGVELPTVSPARDRGGDAAVLEPGG